MNTMSAEAVKIITEYLEENGLDGELLYRLGTNDQLRNPEYRRHPFPGNELGIVDFTGEYLEEPPTRVTTTDLNEANVMSSHAVVDADTLPGMHRPVLDLDIPATLVPSTTPGHSHLYLDALMSWEHYERLLVALAAAGVIEPGYAVMSIERHASYVRLPWIRKERPAMAEVATPSCTCRAYPQCREAEVSPL